VQEWVETVALEPDVLFTTLRRFGSSKLEFGEKSVLLSLFSFLILF